MENKSRSHRTLKFRLNSEIRENLLKIIIPDDNVRSKYNSPENLKDLLDEAKQEIDYSTDSNKIMNKTETVSKKISGANPKSLSHKDIIPLLSVILSSYPENVQYNIDQLDFFFSNLNYENSSFPTIKEKCQIINTFLNKCKKAPPFDQYDFVINHKDFSLERMEKLGNSKKSEYKSVDRYLSIGDYVSAINIYKNGSTSLENIPFNKKLRMLEISIKYGVLDYADELIKHLNIKQEKLINKLDGDNKTNLLKEYKGRLSLATLKSFSQKGMAENVIQLIDDVQSFLKGTSAEVRLCSAYLRTLVSYVILWKKEATEDKKGDYKKQAERYYTKAKEIAEMHNEKHLNDLIDLYEIMIKGVTKLHLNIKNIELKEKIKSLQLELLKFKSNSSPNIKNQTNIFSSLILVVFIEATIYITHGLGPQAKDCLLLANLLLSKSKTNQFSEGFAELLNLTKTILKSDESNQNKRNVNYIYLLELAMTHGEDNRKKFQDEAGDFIPQKLEAYKDPFYLFYDDPTSDNWKKLRADNFIKYYDISDD